MGLTTEHAHIFTGGQHGPQLDQVIAAIRALMAGNGHEEAEGASDRLFVLVPHSQWISVYDTFTGSLDDLSKSLSKSLAANVAAIRLDDSDTYTARLCRAGKWVDKISGGALRRRGSGKPELWDGVLSPGSEDSLARALQGGATFAEEPLRHLCRALHLPEYAALAVPEELSQNPPSGARVLRFRSLLHKAPQGPPVLTLVNRGVAPAVAGQRLPQLSLAVANDGPSSKGLRVRCFGDALQLGLIAPIELRVIRIVAMGGGSGGTEEKFPLSRDNDGWSADLPALELKHRVDPRTLPEGPAMLKAVREYHRSPIYLHITADAIRPGQAELSIRIECLNAPAAPLDVRIPIIVNAAS